MVATPNTPTGLRAYECWVDCGPDRARSDVLWPPLIKEEFMRKSVIELRAKDLNDQGGVYCPSPLAGMTTWDTHPKVYLDVGRTGEAKCPYCGTVYKLQAGEHFSGGGH